MLDGVLNIAARLVGAKIVLPWLSGYAQIAALAAMAMRALMMLLLRLLRRHLQVFRLLLRPHSSWTLCRMAIAVKHTASSQMLLVAAILIAKLLFVVRHQLVALSNGAKIAMPLQDSNAKTPAPTVMRVLMMLLLRLLRLRCPHHLRVFRLLHPLNSTLVLYRMVTAVKHIMMPVAAFLNAKLLFVNNYPFAANPIRRILLGIPLSVEDGIPLVIPKLLKYRSAMTSAPMLLRV